MDIEQLKLILDTLRAAGSGAMTFGVWWLIAELVPNVLLFAFGCWAIVKVTQVLNNVTASSNASWEIATALGHRPPFSVWSAECTEKCLKEIARLKAR